MVWLIRYRWSIAAPTAIPAYLDIEPRKGVTGDWVYGYTPEPWPDSYKEFVPPDQPVEGTSADWSAFDVERVGRSDDEWAAVCEAKWNKDLWRLYSEVVAASFTDQGGPGRFLWDPFLSLCVLHDPPRDNLLWFAHALPWDMPDTYSVEFDDPERVDPAESSKPWMASPPIVDLQDCQLVGLSLTTYFDALIEAASNDPELREAGVDLQAVIRRTVTDRPDLWQEMNARTEALERRRLIEVTPTTTDEDVRNAARLIRATFPDRPKARRPKRDPLTCVQAAIWYDERGWSHERIGHHFGWAIQELDYAKNRCETARLHIAEGRAMLRQRKAAS